MNIMNMMWFMGMCLLSTVIIGGFFIHRDNNIIRKTKNSSFKNEKSKKEVDVAITVSNKDIV